MIREVKEEVSLDIEIIKPLGAWWFFRDKDKAQVICTTFFCKARNKDVDLANNPADEGITDYRWLTKEELLEEELPHESLKDIFTSL